MSSIDSLLASSCMDVLLVGMIQGLEFHCCSVLGYLRCLLLQLLVGVIVFVFFGSLAICAGRSICFEFIWAILNSISVGSNWAVSRVESISFQLMSSCLFSIIKRGAVDISTAFLTGSYSRYCRPVGMYPEACSDGDWVHLVSSISINNR